MLRSKRRADREDCDVCGKVYYDLIEARKKTEDKRVAILRLEQFYPFPSGYSRSIRKVHKCQTVGLDTGRASEHGWLTLLSHV
jgi:2-oxoglutarate dehydrogenase complex dehydrogenase (E1) component-like enzyme